MYNLTKKILQKEEKIISKKPHNILEKYFTISLKTLIKILNKDINRREQRNMRLQKRLKYQIEITKQLKDNRYSRNS